MDLTRRRWYLVAAFVAALAWVAGTAFAASAWDPLREAEVVPVGQPIQINGTDDLAVLTDLPQPERAVTCVARNGKKRTPVPAATVDIVVDSDGSRWHLIGVLPDAPDETRIVCRPADKQTDTARYGTALVDLSSRAGTGRAIAWTGLVAGLGLAGATLTARTRRILAHD
ncbi:MULTISPECIES: hypothetical protein [Aeromicrobium]|uniref:hypothetical protein n=1 Tax=Aeromicrobium TaxID=2040 RepID=UPI0025803CE0|nr:MULTISPECIES: hypothetical protein [Aeromicrobium]